MCKIYSAKIAPMEEREVTIDAGSNSIESYAINSNAIELIYSDKRITSIRVNKNV